MLFKRESYEKITKICLSAKCLNISISLNHNYFKYNFIYKSINIQLAAFNFLTIDFQFQSFNSQHFQTFHHVSDNSRLSALSNRLAIAYRVYNNIYLIKCELVLYNAEVICFFFHIVSHCINKAYIFPSPCFLPS